MSLLQNGVKKLVAPTAHTSNPTPEGPAQALLVRVAGIVKIKCAGDSSYTQLESGELAAGVWHPMQVTHVHTDTTATVLLGYNVY